MKTDCASSLVALALAVFGCGESTSPGSPPLRFQMISGTCGLTPQGVAYCWDTDLIPLRVPSSQPLKTIAVGQYGFLCALWEDGTPACAGPILADTDIRYNLGDTLTPLLGGIKLVTISGGWSHICGIDAAQVIHCWGDFYGGVRGDSTIDLDTAYATYTPNVVSTDLRFSEVFASWVSTCALTVDGLAHCWGIDAFHALGNPSAPVQPQCGRAGPCVPYPVPVTRGGPFVALARGFHHYCGLTTDGSAWCWGRGDLGQLGTQEPLQDCSWNGDPGRCTPTLIRVSDNHGFFVSLVGGRRSTCALDSQGLAYCWGEIMRTEGADTGTVPTLVRGETRLWAISMHRFLPFACGLAADSTAYCWGGTESGYIGQPTPLRAPQ